MPLARMCLLRYVHTYVYVEFTTAVAVTHGDCSVILLTCVVCVCAHVVISTVHTVDKVYSFYMFTLLIHTFQQSTSTVLMYIHAHLQDISAREPLSTAYRVLQ